MEQQSILLQHLKLFPAYAVLYQGLSLLKLNCEREAKQKFQNLLSYGETHINDEPKVDYFAVSLPDLLIFEEDMTIRNQQHCNYLIGLGNLGMKKNELAKKHLSHVFKSNCYHLGCAMHLKLIDKALL